jgi:hypothetical protein
MKFFSGKVRPKSTTTLSSRFNQEVQRRNIKAFSDLAVVGCSIVSLILVIALFNKVNQLENRATPTLVQRNDGSVIEVAAEDSNFRSPEVLKKFVTDALILLMSWSREPAKGQSESLNNSNTKNKPPSYEEQATTIQSDDNKSVAIPTSVFYGSFAFTEAGGFRDVLMKSQIANMIGKTKVMEGQEKTTLSVRTVGMPESIGVGKWKISVVSDFLRWDIKGANIERIAFNKDIYIQVVAQPKIPAGKEPNALEIILQTIRRSKLEIYDMQEIGVPIPKQAATPTPAVSASPSPGVSVSPSPAVSASPSPGASSPPPKNNVFSNKEFIKK